MTFSEKLDLIFDLGIKTDIEENVKELFYGLLLEDVEKAREIFDSHKKLLNVDPKKAGHQYTKIYQALKTALQNINNEVSWEINQTKHSEDNENRTYEKIQSFLGSLGDSNHDFVIKIRVMLTTKLKEIENAKDSNVRQKQRGKQAGRIGTIIPADPMLRTASDSSAKIKAKRKSTFDP